MFLIREVIIVGLCLLMEVVPTESQLKSLSYLKEPHRFKILDTESMKKLAQLSTEESKENFVNNVLHPILIDRVPGSANHQLVQEHIENTMSSLGWQIEKDQFEDNTPFGVKNFTNIIATQNPSAARRLSLACHFDSKLFTRFKFIGATDSAVPCAMMLEIALSMNSTIWKDSTAKDPDLSLQFLFFDGHEAFVRWSEEDSLYGSRHLAQKFEETGQDLSQTMDGLILLHLIGHSDVTFANWFDYTAPWYKRLQSIERRLARAALLEPVNNYKANKYFLDRRPFGFVEDDHIPFLKRGVPVLQLTAAPFPRVWHTKSDNPTRIDLTTIDNITKILRVFVAEYFGLSP